MRSIKRFLAIILMALVVGLGTPVALAAEGTAESPGIVGTQPSGDKQTDGTKTTATVEGTAESPGYFGTAESPGYMATFLIYLDVII